MGGKRWTPQPWWRSCVLWLDLLAGVVLGVAGGSRSEAPGGAILGAILVSAGGGILRDLLFGLPLYVVDNPAFLPVASLGGWIGWRMAHRLPLTPVQIGDLVASAYFGYAGALRLLHHGGPPEGAAVAGVLTGLGGGALFTLLYLPRQRRAA